MDGKVGITMCKLKGGWIREGITWKSKGECKRGNYNVSIKRVGWRREGIIILK